MIAAWGWASVFYVFGAAGVAWYLWWERQAASSPQEDPAISEVGGAGCMLCSKEHTALLIGKEAV